MRSCHTHQVCIFLHYYVIFIYFIWVCCVCMLNSLLPMHCYYFWFFIRVDACYVWCGILTWLFIFIVTSCWTNFYCSMKALDLFLRYTLFFLLCLISFDIYSLCEYFIIMFLFIITIVMLLFRWYPLIYKSIVIVTSI